jgi:OFA family oxalate/formate antiporter-like MFS transporter
MATLSQARSIANVKIGYTTRPASGAVYWEDRAMKWNSRWIQLVAGVICMVMIANLQYGWTYFVDPIDAKFHWGRTNIQIAFTIFVATETWLVPVEGWFVDRFGPRIVVMFGGVVVAFAWVLNSMASTLPALYTAAAISGVGAGAVYGTCVGNALKWFADRRGFAAGLTAAGFGAGAAATVYPIIHVSRPTATTRRFSGSDSRRARSS